MKCFNKKNQHVGPLKVLARTGGSWNVETVFRWCPKCGAAVVDQDSDGRTKIGKMVFPKTTTERLKKSEPKQRVHKSLWEEVWTIKK